METYQQMDFADDYGPAVAYNFMAPFGCSAQAPAPAADFSESWITACLPPYSSGSPEEPLVRYCTPDNPVYCQLSAAPMSGVGPEAPYSSCGPAPYACDSGFTTVPSDSSSHYLGSHDQLEQAYSQDADHLSFAAAFDDMVDNSLSPFSESMALSGGEAISEPRGTGRRRRQPLGPADRRHHQRSAANRRERKRMLLINQHFEVLRAALPAHAQLSLTANAAASPEERRLSKVETLKSAIAYISDLAAYLRALGSADGPSESDSPARLRVRLEEPVVAAGGSIVREVTLSFGRKEVGAKSDGGTVRTNLWFPSIIPVPDLAFSV